LHKYFLKGPKSGCCLRSRRRSPGQLSCVEVFDLLKKLGVEDFSNLSKCLLKGLMSGFIEVPEGADLDTTMFEFKGNIKLTVYIMRDDNDLYFFCFNFYNFFIL
jgi:hypothetical protein